MLLIFRILCHFNIIMQLILGTEILAAINDASTDTYIECVDGSYNGRGFRIEDCVDVATLCPTCMLL